MRMTALFAALATSGAALLAAAPALAEDVQLSIYGGYQTAPHSGVTTSDGTHFTAGWEGKSFASPPYYGGRATWWLGSLGQPDMGLSIDFSMPRSMRAATPSPRRRAGRISNSPTA